MVRSRCNLQRKRRFHSRKQKPIVSVTSFLLSQSPTRYYNRKKEKELKLSTPNHRFAEEEEHLLLPPPRRKTLKPGPISPQSAQSMADPAGESCQNLREESARAVDNAKQLQDSAAAFISRSGTEEQSLRQRALAAESTIRKLRSSIDASVRRGTVDLGVAEKVS